MVSFYKRDIAAWREGTRSLTPTQRDVYSAIIDEIYLGEGPVIITPRYIAGIVSSSPRWVGTAIEQLIVLGKLTRDDRGRLSNGRCMGELAQIRANRENAAKGGKARSSENALTIPANQGKGKNRSSENTLSASENALTMTRQSLDNDSTITQQSEPENLSKNNGAGQASLHRPLKHKEKTVSKKDLNKEPTAEQASSQNKLTYRQARQAVEADLASFLRDTPDLLATIFDFLAANPKEVENATAREQRNPGQKAGALAAMQALHQYRQTHHLND
jgi:hypothetical protein